MGKAGAYVLTRAKMTAYQRFCLAPSFKISGMQRKSSMI
jgi:hypothetical protein